MKFSVRIGVLKNGLNNSNFQIFKGTHHLPQFVEECRVRVRISFWVWAWVGHTSTCDGGVKDFGEFFSQWLVVKDDRLIR